MTFRFKNLQKRLEVQETQQRLVIDRLEKNSDHEDFLELSARTLQHLNF